MACKPNASGILKMPDEKYAKYWKDKLMGLCHFLEDHEKSIFVDELIQKLRSSQEPFEEEKWKKIIEEIIQSIEKPSSSSSAPHNTSTTEGKLQKANYELIVDCTCLQLIYRIFF